MVEVKGLTKYYGEYAAIEDVSFRVEPGEILGFLGPNAAGKTTTMRIIAGFMPPTSGTATVSGIDVVRDSVAARRKLGYLPEQVPLYDDMSVREYLTFWAQLRGVPRSSVPTRVEKVMNDTRVTEYADALILKLSKGFRQRVGIAQALVHDPELLILDEPTVGLDPRQIVEVRELIRGLSGAHTVILSTHILPEVQVVCDRIVIINEGRIAAIDTPEALTARIQKTHEVRMEVRGPAQEVSAALREIKGVISVRADEGAEGAKRYIVEVERDKDIREAAAAAVVKKGWGLRELSTVAMSLEDVYIQLTTGPEGDDQRSLGDGGPAIPARRDTATQDVSSGEEVVSE